MSFFIMSGDAYTRIIAAGSAVISDKPITVKRIIPVGPVYDGTVELYNSPTAGTVAAGLVFSMGTVPATAVNQPVELNLSFSKGLSYYAAGTPRIIVSYE